MGIMPGMTVLAIFSHLLGGVVFFVFLFPAAGLSDLSYCVTRRYLVELNPSIHPPNSGKRIDHHETNCIH